LFFDPFSAILLLRREYFRDSTPQSRRRVAFSRVVDRVEWNGIELHWLLPYAFLMLSLRANEPSENL